MKNKFYICCVELQRYPEFSPKAGISITARLRIRVKVKNLSRDFYLTIPDEIALELAEGKINEDFFGRTYLYKRLFVKPKRRVSYDLSMPRT